MKVAIINFKKIFGNRDGVLAGIIGFLIMISIFYNMGDFEAMKNNFGLGLAYLEIFLEITTSLFFGFFIASIVLKVKIHGRAKKRVGIIGSLGGFLSILVTGCGSCSITLAYYLGLGGLVGLIPYNGIFLKIIGLILMTIGLFFTLRDLDKCPIKAKK